MAGPRGYTDPDKMRLECRAADLALLDPSIIKSPVLGERCSWVSVGGLRRTAIKMLIAIASMRGAQAVNAGPRGGFVPISPDVFFIYF